MISRLFLVRPPKITGWIPATNPMAEGMVLRPAEYIRADNIWESLKPLNALRNMHKTWFYRLASKYGTHMNVDEGLIAMKLGKLGELNKNKTSLVACYSNLLDPFDLPMCK